MPDITLASASEIRRTLLERAGVACTIAPARIDEDRIIQSMQAEDASARDIADTLAEMKAQKIAAKEPKGLVLGCDQVLDLQGTLFQKPQDRAQAAAHLRAFSGQTHTLYSAAVIYEDAKPIWRHVGIARMRMHALSDAEIDDYLDQAWPNVASSVGAYQVEDIGVRLFSRIDGDWFSILGLPLLEICAYLRLRGE